MGKPKSKAEAAAKIVRISQEGPGEAEISRQGAKTLSFCRQSGSLRLCVFA
jgi:hypothetical protein